MSRTGDALLKLAKQNPDVTISGEDLSAAVSNGSTGHVSINSVPTEYDEQDALFAWAAAHTHEWPQLENLYANANGQYRPGQRLEPGLRAGVPDVFLACMQGGHGGLYIELKRQGRQGEKNGGLSDVQVEWIERLRHAGYRACVSYGWEDAALAIKRYLGG
jgi:hypothetical protein